MLVSAARASMSQGSTRVLALPANQSALWPYGRRARPISARGWRRNARPFRMEGAPRDASEKFGSESWTVDRPAVTHPAAFNAKYYS